MLSSFIKFLAITLWAFYCYVRILPIRPISLSKKAALTIYSILLSVLAAVLTHYYYVDSSGTIILILLSLSFLLVYKLFATDYLLCISVIIISYGASVGMKLLSSVVTALIQLLLHPILPPDFVIYLILFALHSALALLVFHIRRFRNGFPFLYKVGARSIGIILSIFILSFYDIASNSRYSAIVIGEALLQIAVFSVLLFFWTKGNLSILYHERQKAKELEYAYSILREKDELIRKLQADNEKMAKIIHRDNKLIPSLENAVRIIFTDHTGADMKTKSLILIQQLNELVKERSGMVMDSIPASAKLPKTDLALIDMMAEYMHHKAEGKGVAFRLEVLEAPAELTPLYISEKDLCTIFADLIENALLSVSSTEVKDILVQLGLYNGLLTLSVSDSGIPFKARILYTLGKKQKTTYAETGGSGIGIMSLFEINKKSRASFVLTEYGPDTNSYRKKVSVVFDGRYEYRIHSYRSNELKKNCNRSDIIFNQLP